MMMKISALLLGGLLTACALATDPATGGEGDGHDEVTFTDQVHAMPMLGAGTHQSGDGLAAPSAPSGAHLTYYGGKVVQNANVVSVLYGSGTFIPQITGSGAGSFDAFYNQALSSGVFDWLIEYNTSSPSQAIGRGSSSAHVQIAPSSSHNGSTITDASIQAELAANIQSGALPAASDNRIYMVNFPAGKTITDPSGSASCSVFCAYHGTFKIGSQNVYYGVLPDMTGACANGCGNAPTTFANATSVASHELIETVTDAEVGLATTVGAPIAWYDTTNGEIGDICNAQQGTFTGTDSVSYTIQQEFSNQASNCITTRSTTTSPDFSLAVSPSSSTVTAGSSTTVQVATSAIAGSSQTVSLSVSGLPSGVTGSFSPASVTAGATSTLTLAASASASGSGTFTVTGTSGTKVHNATASLAVSTGGGGGGGGGGNVLSNGVPVSGLSGATGSDTTWTIAVPAGQSSLVVTISGGTGDADLYVRAGSAPTKSTYDCRPYINGNSETCTISNPAAGTFYVMLDAYATYSGVTLTATYSGGGTTDPTTVLGNNVPVSGLSGATGSAKYYKITVPAGQSQLVFQMSGGTGDADLYVKKGAKPTTSTYDCRPYLVGNNETCTFASPVATDYYVMVRGYAAYTGASLVGHYP